MKLKKKSIIAIIAVILCLAILAVTAFFIFKPKDTEGGNSKKPSSSESEVLNDDIFEEDESDSSNEDSNDKLSDEDEDDSLDEEKNDDISDEDSNDDSSNEDEDDSLDEEKNDDMSDEGSDDNSSEDSDIDEDDKGDEDTFIEREILSTLDLNGDVYFTDFKTADTVYYIDVDALDTATVDMLMSLQGIVAKTESQIYLKKSDDKIAFEELQNYYGIKMVKVTDPWDLVDKFKSHLTNNGFVKYIVYDSSANYFLTPYAPTSVNVAAVISGQENYLMVDESLIETAKAHGLVERANALDYDEYAIFQEYRDEVNQKVFASLSNTNHALYDVTIALGCMVSRGSDVEWMLSKLEPDGIFIGWHDNESKGVQAASTQGYATLPLDNGRNFSLYAGLEHKKQQQKSNIKYEQKGNSDVHYVTFIMSDGDNLCYDYNMVATDNYYGTQSHGEIPFGWSLSPATYEWAPNIVKNLYDNMSYHDNFVASVSGLGYMFPNIYPQEYLDAFAKRTAEYMKMNDMNYITLASSNADAFELDSYVPSFSQYDQILGGHFNDMSSESECYVHTKYGGGVVWYNDKPFVYDRESLAINWEITAERGITRTEAISQMAYRINNVYKRDINSIEGYTIINVHPWSVSYEDAVTLTKQFNDDVIVVTPSEFFELVKKNVPHEDYLDMEGKNLTGEFDYSAMVEKEDSHFIIRDTFERLAATDVLSYNFAGGTGTGSWKLRAGTDTNDQIYYDGNSIYMRGYKVNGVNNYANNEIYNKISLPNSIKQFTYRLKGSGAMRLLALSDGTLTVVKDWTKASSTSVYEDVTVDISKYAGKTVTFILQMQDCNGAISTCNINKINIS